jgi:hypothetical protein
LRAIDSKPPHGFSPYGHVANSSCPNHLQAFGGFVQILHIQIFLTEGNEGNEGASRIAFAFTFGSFAEELKRLTTTGAQRR